MGLFSFFRKKKLFENESIENYKTPNNLLNLAKVCVLHLSKEYKHLSAEGEIEALFFFCTLITDLGKIESLDALKKSDQLIGQRYNHNSVSELYSFLDYITHSFVYGFLRDNFIRNRVSFYTTQYQKLKNEPYYSPMFIYNAFYLKPLSEYPDCLQEFNESPIELFKLQKILYELEAHINYEKKKLGIE